MKRTTRVAIAVACATGVAMGATLLYVPTRWEVTDPEVRDLWTALDRDNPIEWRFAGERRIEEHGRDAVVWSIVLGEEAGILLLGAVTLAWLIALGRSGRGGRLS